MTLKLAIRQAGLSYRPFAKALRLHATAVSRIVNYGEYPVKIGKQECMRRITEVLVEHGIPETEIEWPASGVRPGYPGVVRRTERSGAAVERHEVYIEAEQTEAIELMQLDRSVLSIFGLRTNPFLNDVETDEDVFPYKGHEQVTTAIQDAIDQRGFLAVAAPSGAGKTTIWDGIEAEYGRRDDCIICKPQLKTREKLSPEHLVRALIRGLLGEDCHIAHDAEQRGRQLSNALRAIRTGAIDKKAVLYIDDAHFCTASVLRQLKTFFEEKIGRYRLLAIILVGLPELKHKLASFPEIGNRIRLVEVPQVPLREYLEFKLRRVGSSIDKLFDANGWAAFEERFRAPRRPAMGYPLIINAATIQAMCKLAQNGAQPGERITREIVDMLPGGSTVRRVA
jgi:type II secretory pathway predicted ATPase ExeA